MESQKDSWLGELGDFVLALSLCGQGQTFPSTKLVFSFYKIRELGWNLCFFSSDIIGMDIKEKGQQLQRVYRARWFLRNVLATGWCCRHTG